MARLAGLEQLVSGARARWPGVEAPLDGFVAFIAERLPGQAPLAVELSALHVDDLYLAYGCAHGDRAALAHFESVVMSLVPNVVKRFDRSSDFAADVCQQLRERMLVGRDARIGHYAGRGPLASWVRVAALRCALNLVQRDRPALVDPVLAAPADAIDPELALIAEHHREELTRALSAATARLPSEDLLLLKLHHIDGLGLAELAALQRTSKTSLFRRLKAIRARVAAETRRELGALLPRSPATLASLLRLVNQDPHGDLARVISDKLR